MTVLIVISALIFSFIGTLVGLGGGVFMVPLLVLVADFELPIAVGCVAISLFPSAMITTLTNIRRRNVDFHAFIRLEIPTIFGAWIGAYLTAILPVKPLEFLFSAFILFMAWNLRHKKEVNESSLLKKFNNIYATSTLGALAGVLAGLFGVGGGILKTPLLLKVFKLPAKRAAATSIAMIMVTAAVSATKHYQLGHIDGRAYPVIAGFVSGSIIGNIFGKKVSDQKTQTILSYALVAASLAVALHAWQL